MKEWANLPQRSLVRMMDPPTRRGEVSVGWGRGKVTEWNSLARSGAQSAAKVFFRSRLAAGVLKAEDAYAVGRHEGEDGGKLMICEPIVIEGGQNEVRGERGSEPDAIKI